MQPKGERKRTKVALALEAGALVLVAGGASAIGVALASQQHAPAPVPKAAGTTGPTTAARDPQVGGGHPGAASPDQPEGADSPAVIGPSLPRADPVAIAIPAIGVSSALQELGLASTGAIAVPPPGPTYNEAAWFDGSPTPGAVGPSIIEGHVDSTATGPSVFFRLGALVPGDVVDVTLSNGTVAVFSVTGVRQYPKASFPTGVVYGNTNFAGLRLITCGGAFDAATGHYLSNTVVFASLTSSHPASGSPPPAPSP